MNILSCPTCSATLKDNSVCEECSIAYLGGNGVYDFSGGLEQYWGEVSREEMIKAVSDAKERGWRAAIESVSAKFPDLKVYLSSAARIDWLFHCINHGESDRCLDVGSGWGTLSFLLTNYYKEVWSLENVKERMDFQRVRQEQDRTSNLRLIRADLLSLPFADNIFDLIVVNGVLEWIGLSDRKINPRKLQEAFLKELFRILARGGCLYIGIENRFGMQFIRGARDHSGKRFTSLVPRRVADVYMSLCRRRTHSYSRKNRTDEEWADYRTYTYSIWGYKALLKEAGFRRSVVYWTLDYNNPKYSAAFSANSIRYFINLQKEQLLLGKKGIMSLVIFLLSLTNRHILKCLFLLFSPCYLIYAYKTSMQVDNFENKLLSTYEDDNPSIQIGGGHSLKSKINVFSLVNSTPSFVLKYARFAQYHNIDSEEMLMAKYSGLCIIKRLVENIPVFVEPAIRGRYFNPHKCKETEIVLDWLIRFQENGSMGCSAHQYIISRINEITAFVDKIGLGRAIKVRVINNLEMFMENTLSTEIDSCHEHGDLAPCNILMIGKGQPIVIDWELYREQGDPFYDFGFLLLQSASVGNFPKSFIKNVSGNGRFSRQLHMMINGYSVMKGFKKDLIWQSINYTILRCLSEKNVWHNDQHIENDNYIVLMKLWDSIYDKKRPMFQ